jgi:hypothetical protein
MNFTVKDEVLGECEVEASGYHESIVDTFLESGYSIDLDRELTNEELDRLQEQNIDWISNEIYCGGHSRNHN